jgi:hypothetical protein
MTCAGMTMCSAGMTDGTVCFLYQKWIWSQIHGAAQQYLRATLSFANKSINANVKYL